ncbi:4292_t:CDS:2, partial [Scutellospora calospora]
LYQEYSDFKTKLEKVTNHEQRYKNYITMLNNLSKNELMIEKVLDKVYALCVLFNSSKNIYVILRYEIPFAIEENSKIFPNSKTEDIYRTAVYIADIRDVTPQYIESEKNSNCPKEEIINEVIENCEVVENCEVEENCDMIHCNSINCDDINNNSINYTTINTEDEEIEEEILKI